MWRRRGGADPGATPPVPVNTPVEGVAAVAAPAPAAGARAEEALAALAADDEVEAAAPPPAEAEAGAGAEKGSSQLSRSFPKDPFAAASPAASLRDAKAAVHAAAVGDGGLGMQSLGETLSGTNRSKSIAEIESEQSAPQKAHAQHQARGFFVRIVAQRELAVSEDKWIEVLARHAQQGYERMAKASKALASGAAGGSLPDMSEEALIHQTRFRWPVLEVISPYTLFYMTWTYFMMAVSASPIHDDPERGAAAGGGAGSGTDAPTGGHDLHCFLRAVLGDVRPRGLQLELILGDGRLRVRLALRGGHDY